MGLAPATGKGEGPRESGLGCFEGRERKNIAEREKQACKAEVWKTQGTSLLFWRDGG
jgi:hypothetical protein